MPQPLTNYPWSKDLIIFKLNELHHRPELASLMMEALHSWTLVESNLLTIFVEIFGGRKSVATAIYLSLETSSAKRSAIKAASEQTLDEELQDILDAILKKSKSHQTLATKLLTGFGDIRNIFPIA